MTLINETIYKRIVYYRNNCQLTQIELASKVGIRLNHFIEIEAVFKIPRPNELKRLAVGLDISITELVGRS